MDIRTVRFENSDGPPSVTPLTLEEQNLNPLALPDGLDFWQPSPCGEVLSIYPNDAEDGPMFRGG